MSANTEAKAQEMILANAATIFNYKSKGSKIVALYCDNLISKKGIISDFYRNILLASDHVIFPTESLRKASSSYISAKTQSHIIEDPWQIMHEHRRKSIAEGESCKMLWFGSNANIQYLLNILEELLENLEQSRMFELSILGGPYAIDQTRIILSSIPKKYPNWAVRLVKWDSKNQPMQLEKELKRSHISLIPSDPLDPQKIGVSHNRLVDSLRGGCLTIASPMESYKELHSCCLLGDDFPRLINQSILDYDNISERLLKHRSKNLTRFNPAENIRKWTRTWRKILQN